MVIQHCVRIRTDVIVWKRQTASTEVFGRHFETSQYITFKLIHDKITAYINIYKNGQLKP